MNPPFSKQKKGYNVNTISECGLRIAEFIDYQCIAEFIDNQWIPQSEIHIPKSYLGLKIYRFRNHYFGIANQFF